MPEGYALHAQELFVQGFQPPSEQHGAQARKDASEAAATSPAKESADTRQTGNWRNRDGSRKGAKKLGRAGKFVEKLVEIFGHDRLAGSSVGVLDVAGGSGDVAFELSVRRGIPCTIIDPRATTAHTKRQMRVLRHRRRSQQILSKGTEVSPLARHVYGRFSSTEANVLAAEFHSDFGSSEEEARLLKECTAIIGMHPDQATDAIVDVAIQVKKPYAIVPCCVFAKMFPHRKLPGIVESGDHSFMNSAMSASIDEHRPRASGAEAQSGRLDDEEGVRLREGKQHSGPTHGAIKSFKISLPRRKDGFGLHLTESCTGDGASKKTAVIAAVLRLWPTAYPPLSKTESLERAKVPLAAELYSINGNDVYPASIERARELLSTTSIGMLASFEFRDSFDVWAPQNSAQENDEWSKEEEMALLHFFAELGENVLLISDRFPTRSYASVSERLSQLLEEQKEWSERETAIMSSACAYDIHDWTIVAKYLPGRNLAAILAKAEKIMEVFHKGAEGASAKEKAQPKPKPKEKKVMLQPLPPIEHDFEMLCCVSLYLGEFIKVKVQDNTSEQEVYEKRSVTVVSSLSGEEVSASMNTSNLIPLHVAGGYEIGIQAVGRRILLPWKSSDKGQFFAGTVVSFNSALQLHRIQFYDCDELNVNLSTEKFVWFDPSTTRLCEMTPIDNSLETFRMIELPSMFKRHPWLSLSDITPGTMIHARWKSGRVLGLQEHYEAEVVAVRANGSIMVKFVDEAVKMSVSTKNFKRKSLIKPVDVLELLRPITSFVVNLKGKETIAGVSARYLFNGEYDEHWTGLYPAVFTEEAVDGSLLISYSIENEVHEEYVASHDVEYFPGTD
eukprot:g4428.t1